MSSAAGSRATRNQRTSIGAPTSSTANPAAARTVEGRPSQLREAGRDPDAPAKVARDRLRARTTGELVLQSLDERAEDLLRGKAPSEELFVQAGEIASADCSPTADGRGPVDYKRHLAGVLTVRALRRATARALHSPVLHHEA